MKILVIKGRRWTRRLDHLRDFGRRRLLRRDRAAGIGQDEQENGQRQGEGVRNAVRALQGGSQ